MISRVGIGPDDKCDSCGQTDRRGISFGPQKPIICTTCLSLATDVLHRVATGSLLEELLRQEQFRKERG